MAWKFELIVEVSVKSIFCRGVMQGLLALMLVAAVAGCAPEPKQDGSSAALPQSSTAKPTVVFMTDFGVTNDAVAICKAVMYGIAPDLRIRDITHSVTPFSIEEGARFLEGVSPYYPAGTVFVAVVDPGVGTSRKAVVVKTKKGQFFVVPDNGLVSPVVDRDGLDSAREITNTGWMIGDKVSSTFHGRDIFSPVGAHLSAGGDWTLVGPVVTDLVRLTPKTSSTTDKGIEGDVIGLDDPYGSLITDIPGEEFKKLGYVLGDKVTVQINKKPFTAPFMKTFMDVPVGSPLLYVDSRGRVGLAVNQGSFSQVNKITPPATIFVAKKSVGGKNK
jgi:S-adenosylmethionine hydrolase